MLFSKKTNTVIVGLYIFSIIVSAAFGGGKFSFWGLANWGTMLALLVTSFYQYPGKYPVLPMAVFSGCLILHTLYGETSWLSSSLLLVNFLLYLFVCRLPVKTEWIGYLLGILMVVNGGVGILQHLHVVEQKDWLTSFTGLFENPNSTVSFGCSALAAVLLFVRNNRVKVAALVAFALYLATCHSRNAVLFTAVTGGMYFLLNTRWKKSAVWLYLLFFIFCLYFMIVLEPHLALEKTGGFFGKDMGSSGRSHLLLLAVKYFPLTFWGEGVNMPNFYVAHFSGYAIHNFYVNTLYAMGCVYSVIYIIFVVQLYRALQSTLARAFLFGFHIFFMFEPGLAFGATMVVGLPILLLLLKLGEEKHEHRTRHTVL